MKSVPQPNEAESIMLNVAGRLLMFQRDRSSSQPKPKDGHDRPVSTVVTAAVSTAVRAHLIVQRPKLKKGSI